jgi:hypothetical protein
MRAAIIAATWALALAPAVWTKSASIREETKTCDIDLKYPVTGQAAIDADLAKWVADRANEFQDGCKDAAKEGNLGPAGKFSAEMSFQIHRNDARAVSIAFDNYTYTGGAHPNTQQFGRTYLKPDGRRVYIAELIGLKGLRELSAYAIKDLMRQWGSDPMSDEDWVKSGAAPQAYNFEAFVWTAKGDLVVQFSPYQVAAYAAGPQTVTVPERIVRGWLRPDPREPQPSFDCARAQTAIETAICADWRLARADRQMAEDYQRMMDSGYEPAEKQKLKRSQRAWLKHRDAACGRARAMAACLMPLIDKRRAEIGAPRE